MENSISKNWYLLLIRGIIMILLAVLIFMSPGDVLLTYVLYIGIGYLFAGLIRIFQGFQAKGHVDSWGSIAMEGVFDIVFGFILIAHPGMTLAVLPFLIGFWGAIYGLSLVVNSFSEKENKGMKLLAGILTAIFALIIMFNPLLMGMTLVIWVGIMILVAGIFNVVIAFKIK